MPYIKEEDRDDVRCLSSDRSPKTPGELNFLFTEIIADYFELRNNYQAINDIIGALEGAKLEFYRRIAVPYEDQKIIENGDVY